MTEGGREPADAPEPASMEALFAVLAERMEAVEIASVDALIEHRRAARPFAVALAGAAEFRLQAEIAEAVLRTPDTAPSARGAGWVRFAPPVLDRFARDRAEAWYLTAWRTAPRSG